jgi:UDP-N-acetylmuramate dehydrogenase
MQPVPNVSLRNHSTMRLGGLAAYAIDIFSVSDIHQALTWARTQNLPVRMIGSGSNIIWRDEGFNGLLLVDKIKGYEMTTGDSGTFVVEIGAGEDWDAVIQRTVDAGLTGIEALSLIPGSSGATPVQNVGAYGQEIADTLVSVAAIDARTGELVTIPNKECAFGYRTSRFKVADAGRFFITGITLQLRHGNPEPPFYGAVQQYFTDHGVTDITPHALRDAVIDIRSHKLPDPAIVANNGSFFSNPIVDETTYNRLAAQYPTMPHWPADNGQHKLSAAWLIEQAGFKDYHDPATGMATWHTQPLVFINEHATRTADLLKFKQKILDAVQNKFGVALLQEPELLP